MSTVDLPSGWTEVRLADVCAVNPRDPHLADETEVSFVPMAAVSEVTGTIEQPEVRPTVDVKKGFTSFANDDVIFAKITPCMENGKSAVARGLLNGRGYGSTEFVVLRSKGGIVPEFLHRYVRQESYRRDARATMQSGVGQARVPKEFIQNTPLMLPPLPEQKRIVARLDALQTRSRTAREALAEVPALLDLFRQSVLASAFRGDLTAEWRAKHPVAEPGNVLLERIRAERKRLWEAANPKKPYVEPTHPDISTRQLDVPVSWSVCSVADVSDCLDRLRRPVTRADREPGPYPYFGANGQVDTVGKYIFDDELVLVTEDETFYGRTKPIAYRVSGKCWVNNHAHVLRAVHPVPVDFLWLSLMHYDVEPWLSGTTGRAKLTQGALMTLPVALPPLDEMAVIVSTIGRCMQVATGLAALVAPAIADLDTLDQTILARAFGGELVEQDPNDEPAEKLLARIREQAEGAPTARRGRSRRSAG